MRGGLCRTRSPRLFQGQRHILRIKRLLLFDCAMFIHEGNYSEREERERGSPKTWRDFPIST